MTIYTPMPFIFPQWFDGNGNPAVGYRLFTYAAGSSTKLATAQDSAAAAVHSNPITLDAAGRPPAAIFMQPLPYKLVLAPPGSDDPPTTTTWSADNVYPPPANTINLDISGVAGETLAVNNVVFLSDGTGGNTAGRWYKADADLALSSTLPACIGISLTAASAAGSITVRRLGRVTDLSGLTAGSTYYVSATGGALTSTAPSNTRRVGVADSTTTLILAGEIEEPLRGFVDLPLESWREISANEIINAAGNGGLLASDTTPALIRINTSTDKGVRINWVATNSDEITQRFTYPNDLDDGNALEFHMLAASGGATNSPTVQVDYFEGLGDTNAGGATGAVTGTTITEYTRTIAASDVGAAPNFASVSLTPAAHATDALRVYATWIEYTKKLRST